MFSQRVDAVLTKGVLFAYLLSLFFPFFGGIETAEAAANCNGLTVTITGTGGADTITGTAGDDVIDAQGGNDTITGNGGNDTICAGNGDDTVNTDSGNDWIDGEGDDDIINAGDGTNEVEGGNGNDTITTGAGNDTIDGEGGNDIINAGGGTNDILGGNGDDTITSGSGNDTIDGEGDDDEIDAGDGTNNVLGGNGNDDITTGSGNDTVNGEGNTDTCNAGSGSNTVSNCEKGRITIVKDASPDDDEDFAFSGGLGSFTLDDDSDGTLPNSQTFTVNSGASYTVTEASVANWSVQSITCSDLDAGTVTNTTTRSAAIDLDQGEAITCTFVNAYQDVVAPVITLVGSNPQVIEVGSAYTELGATASDDVDGDISGSIVINASAVNVNVVGSYSVTYNVSDTAGNPATQVTRTVQVVDTVAPVITLLGSNPQTMLRTSAYSEAGATAADGYDGDISGSIVIDASAVNVNVVGSYSVTYNVSDSSGNPALTVTRTVDVVDSAPVITLVGSNPQTIVYPASYTELGATASDDVDGDISGSIVIDASAVNTSAIGTYTVTYNVTDANGTAATQVTRTVQVVDQTMPVISLLGSNPQTILRTSAYTELGATASDDVDGDISGSIVIDASAVNVNVVGSYSVTYDVSDSSTNAALTVTRTVNVIDEAPVITLIGSNPQNLFAGSSYVELGATASDDVDGDISGSIVIDASAVNMNAVGSYTVTYNVTDANGTAATQVTRTVNVNQAPTTTVHLSVTNPTIVGQDATFTATVTGFNPTGTVDIKEGSTVLGTITLSNGSGSFVTDALAVGSHSIAAEYSGDTNNQASTSASVVVHIVDQSPTSTLHLSVPNPSIVGQDVTFTATVTGFSPTGSVTVVEGATTLGVITLSNGSGVLVVNSLSVGSHSIDATYSGDTNNLSSVASVVVQVVDKDSPSALLESNLNPSIVGQNVTLTATLSGGFNPTGTFTFFDGAISLGSVTIGSMSGSMTTNSLSVGSHSITAQYSGDGNNNATTTSPVVVQVVEKSPTSVTIILPAATKSVHEEARIIAQVSGFSPTGTIIFKDGDKILGGEIMDNGEASLYTIFRPAGDHAITALYGGDANNLSSTGSAVISIVENTEGSDSDSPNASGRGSGTRSLGASASFLAAVHGLGGQQGAFGGLNETPLSETEKQYICSMQRALPLRASSAMIDAIAGIMSLFMSRDAELIGELLRDDSLCTSSVSLKGAQASAKLKAFPIDASGNPVSSNATWNACIRGRVTLEQIRANTDRDEDGNAVDCGSYHTGTNWRHPDLSIYFTWDRKKKTLELPEGFVPTQELLVSSR